MISKTLCSLVEAQCSLALLKECKRRSQLWPSQPQRLRSLLALRGSIQHGLAAPSSLLFQPSSRYGSQSRSMRNLDLPSSTTNAFKVTHLLQSLSLILFCTTLPGHCCISHHTTVDYKLRDGLVCMLICIALFTLAFNLDHNLG